MSASWKGWTTERAAKDGVIGYEFVFATRDGMRSHTSLGGHKPHPVLVQPIEDESLPHPGDGKEWELARSTECGRRGHPVVVLGAPYQWTLKNDGRYTERTSVPTNIGSVLVCDLRERKAEPEHGVGRKPSEHMDWCPRSKSCTPGHCTCTEECECERRSGEERRKGERRDGLAAGIAARKTRPSTWVPRGGREYRSGEDRRSR